jgi:hypothetical protein
VLFQTVPRPVMDAAIQRAAAGSLRLRGPPASRRGRRLPAAGRACCWAGWRCVRCRWC